MGYCAGAASGLCSRITPRAVLGTYPALYQLMPRDRHRRLRFGRADGPSPGPLYDAGTWAERGWGLLDPAQDDRLTVLLPDAANRTARRDQALAHTAQALRRAERLHAALDRPSLSPGPDLFLVVGAGLDTPATLLLDPATAKPARMQPEEGDGVVLRASALRDEAQGNHRGAGARPDGEYRTVLLLPGEHVELTRDPVFADNLLYWLLDAPRFQRRST